MKIEPVRLGVGEKVERRPYTNKQEPLFFKIGDTTIDEMFSFDGGYWVANPSFRSDLGGRIFREFHEVLSIQPAGARPFYRLDVQAKPGELKPIRNALNDFLHNAQADGELHPAVNGIIIMKSGKADVVEPIRGGEDKVLIRHNAFVEAQLLRYVPATPENRENLSSVFGPIFNSKRL